jgi:cellulose synthase/poly-beta-1,6-N-acetylglucosamine synthase-like glycosyltransferase
MILDRSSLLKRSFKKYLPFGVFITLAYLFLSYNRGLAITIITIFILNISFFIYFLISSYLEGVRSISKIILSAILSILYFSLIFPIFLILIGEDFSDPLFVRKTFTTMLYLTIAYILFSILLEYFAR